MTLFRYLTHLKYFSLEKFLNPTSHFVKDFEFSEAVLELYVFKTVKTTGEFHWREIPFFLAYSEEISEGGGMVLTQTNGVLMRADRPLLKRAVGFSSHQLNIRDAMHKSVTAYKTCD
ncbi:hypothetical protein DdX_07432 [Ditylenchus destructor]|uniref:Uncharacterized protein n=1 Tax=Ditylenchus destructor TaxID=166010 RepID=A0AAD4R518_9BILA|nr:hypothetical protein DdX_07432 [Ditylenchus destructor]